MQKTVGRMAPWWLGLGTGGFEMPVHLLGTAEGACEQGPDPLTVQDGDYMAAISL